MLLHLRVLLDDLAVGTVQGSVIRYRGGMGGSMRRSSRVCNGPVSGEYLCHMREGVVAVKPFSVGKDAVADGREAEVDSDLFDVLC